MKFKIFSVIVGTNACIASCPFCVSREDIDENNIKPQKINFRNFEIACNLANRSGVDTVMLTSRGEPLLFPDQISDYLKHLKKYNFPFIELQTNGILFMLHKDKYEKYLNEWYKNGLTTITISIVSNRPEINKQFYMPHADSYIDLPKLVSYLHSFGFCVRLTCICCKGITDTPEKFLDMIKFAKENKVEQLTMRPLNDEFRRIEVEKWIDNNKLSLKQKKVITKWLDKNGTKLLSLERIGNVYDVYGQNLMFSCPLNKYTRDTNPDNARQLIFFQDGHIRYEWEMEGGNLL
jgi:molybdenum cofactor biosynthesis enzyme MoaA